MSKKMFSITSKDFLSADEWLVTTFGQENVQENISLAFKAYMIPELMQLYGDYLYTEILNKIASEIKNTKTNLKTQIL